MVATPATILVFDHLSREFLIIYLVWTYSGVVGGGSMSLLVDQTYNNIATISKYDFKRKLIYFMSH